MKLRYLLLMFIGFVICIIEFKNLNSTFKILIVFLGISLFIFGLAMFMNSIKKAKEIKKH